MSIKQELFTDGIEQINYSSNMVRMDFMTLQPTYNNENPIAEVNFRVIMTTHAFLDVYNNMQQLINKLIDAGVLSKQEKIQEQNN